MKFTSKLVLRHHLPIFWEFIFIMAHFLGLFSLSSTAQVRFVKSIPISAPFDAQFVGAVQNKYFFTANQPYVGNALWVSDGSPGGTFKLGDTTLSVGNTYVIGNKIYFLTGDYFTGYLLWSTDGTKQGTVPVRNGGDKIKVGSFYPSQMDWFVFSDSTGYHTSDGSPTGVRDLIRTDTVQFRDTHYAKYLSTVFAYQDKLLMVIGTGQAILNDEVKVFSIDVKTGETSLLLHLLDPNGEGKGSLTAYGFKMFGNQVVFCTQNKVKEFSLWKTDGTVQGTQLIKTSEDSLHFQSPLGSSGSLGSDQTIVYQNRFFFSASDNVHGTELWVTDGTSQGTHLFDDLAPGKGTFERFINNKDSLLVLPYSSIPQNYVVHGGTLYFTASDTSNSTYFWGSDGTSAGTEKLSKLGSLSPLPYTLLPNALVFINADTLHGAEPWATGTASSPTLRLKDIWPSIPDALAQYDTYYGAPDNTSSWGDTLGGHYYFVANDGKHGKEVWVTDGSPNGTKQLLDISMGAEDSNPFGFKTVSSNVFFIAKKKGAYFLCMINDTILTDTTSSPKAISSFEEWHQTLGGYYPAGFSTTTFLNSLETDASNNIWMAGDCGVDLTFYDKSLVVKNDERLGFSARPFLAKLDPQGNILFAKFLGRSVSDFAKLALDSSGNAFLTCSYYSDINGYFRPQYKYTVVDGDTLKDAFGIFIAKFDPSGKKQWVRSISLRDYGEVKAISCDEGGYVYVTGIYRQNMAHVGSTTISSAASPSYFIARYSPKGELSWLKNVNFDYSLWTMYGQTAALQAQKGRVHLVVSQGGPFTSASCAFTPFYIQLTSFDALSGDVVWNKNFTGSDFNYVSQMAIDQMGQLKLVGRFRGSLYFGHHGLHSDRVGDCNVGTSFIATIEAATGNIVRVNSDNPNQSVHNSIKIDKEGNTLVAGNQWSTGEGIDSSFVKRWPNVDGSVKTYIKKFDAYDRLLSERYFYLPFHDDGFFISNPLVTEDQQGYLIFSDFTQGTYDTIPQSRLITGDVAVWLMKMRQGTSVFKEYPINPWPPDTNSQFIIYPNPFSNYVLVLNNDTSFLHYQIKVYDMAGHELLQFSKEDHEYAQSIDLSSLSSGMYLLRFYDDRKTIVRKVIKYE
jgi:ELWxxDGT repeat protein